MPKPDPVESAARTAAEVISRHEQPLPADVEQAWATWIDGIANVDERVKLLLRHSSAG